MVDNTIFRCINSVLCNETCGQILLAILFAGCGVLSTGWSAGGADSLSAAPILSPVPITLAPVHRVKVTRKSPAWCCIAAVAGLLLASLP